MNAIIDAALNRSRTVFAALVMILGAGWVIYQDIPKESDPDVDIPLIYVSIPYEGISPEDGERLLIRPMETKLKTVEGLKEMRGTAIEGRASIVLEFEAGFNADKALRDVRDKVDQAKKDLPDDTKEPTVDAVNASLFPVLVVTLSGNVPERTLIRIARNLKDRLEGLPGVLEATFVGERKELLEILVNPTKLENYRISPSEVLNVVTVNNRLVAAGAVETGEGRFAVKVPGLFETAKDALELPIKSSAEGVVTLGDVTSIRPTFKDPTSFARLDGKPAIALEIKKRIGENVIDTVAEVQKLVLEEQRRWPGSINVTFTQDKSKNITDMLGDLQNNLFSAVLMVMIIVVASLGMRSAMLVGIAIPASFLMGIMVLYGLGLTINIVVLFSLILAAGNVVDGAIVVTEYAERRMTEGMPKREAYALAAKRMAWPIIASIATQACAFMPLLFWPGVVGEFMKYLPITQVVTLIASLIVALVFVTVLGSYFGKAAHMDARMIAEVEAAERGDLNKIKGFMGAYARLLRMLVRHPVKVTLATLGILIGVQAYYATHGNGVEFFPDVDPTQALIYVHARGNLSIYEKDRLVREVEARVIGHPGIQTVYTRVGGRSLRETDEAEDVIGVLRMEFVDWKQRSTAKEILRQLRVKTADLAGIQIETRFEQAGPPTGKDVQIQLGSYEADLLPALVEKVRAKMNSLPQLIDVEDTRPQPGIEWQIHVDRAQAGRFGADVATVGAVVQFVTTGVKVGEYRPDGVDEQVEIRVRFPADERGISQIDSLRVETAKGSVPISNFVTRSAQQSVGSINRFDGKRVYLVRANVADGVLVDTMVQEMRGWLANTEIDPRIEVKFRGKDEEQKKAADFLSRAFSMAMFLMAIVLVTQFNSFYHAFLILTAVILSTIGVVLGLIITGQTFGIVMTGIGIIALAGIVVNNNIVLIDAYAELRRGGMPAEEAAIRTGVQRLRPVFLTAIVSVLGLLPLSFRTNIDFVGHEVSIGAPATQWWVQISTAIAFGLSFATLLTLLITPSLLVLGERFGLGTRRVFRWFGWFVWWRRSKTASVTTLNKDQQAARDSQAAD